MKKHILTFLAFFLVIFSNNLYANSAVENNDQTPQTTQEDVKNSKDDIKADGENISVADSDPDDIKKNVDLSAVEEPETRMFSIVPRSSEKQFVYSSQSGNVMLLYNYETLEQSTYMIGWGYLMEYLGVNQKDGNYYDVRFQGSIHALHRSDVEKFIPLSQIKSFPHYINENGRVNHYIEGNPLEHNSWAFNSDLGDAPSWMVPGKKYYSFSGIYFTESPEQLGAYTQQTNAVNAHAPYYDYYLYQPLRTKTSYSASELDSAFNYFYNNSWTSGQPTIMHGTGWKFLDAEHKYGTNALMVLSLGIHEGAYGTSAISINKNNPFGYAAYDSNTGEAKRFASINEAIDYVSGDYLSWVHSDPTAGSNYFGNHFGNKGSGINMKYASDPLWGEKNANIYAKIDRYLGKQDYQKYGLSIARQGTPVYWQPGANRAFSYRASRSPLTYMYPVVTYNNDAWTQVGMEPPFDSNNEIDYWGRYNWDFGYIHQNDLLTISLPKSSQPPVVEHKYPVTYHTNGADSGTVPETHEYLESETVTVSDANNLGRYGYNFVGWNTKADGTGTAYTATNQFAMPHDAVTLYAQWSAISNIPVTFDLNYQSETITAPIEVTFGHTYGTPLSATPHRLGYTFTGWYDAAVGGNKIDANTTVTNASGHTLYAQWEVVTGIQVKFALNYNGAEDAVADINVQFGGTYTLPENPNRFGYVFTGWYDAEIGGNKVEAKTTVANPSAHTLYAQWEVRNNIGVTFDLNYANAPVGPAKVEVAFNKQYGTTSKGQFPGTPDRFGYVFTGWYDATVGGNKIDATTVVTNAEAHTLYAQWQVITNIPVTFDLNYSGAVDNIPNIAVQFDGTYGLPVQGNFPGNQTRFGYVFTGWYDAAVGGNKVDSHTTISTINGHTLYAQWEVRNNIGVTFDLNYPNAPVAQNKIEVAFNKLYGESSKGQFPSNPTRFGYQFTGWYDAATEGNIIDAATIVTNPETHTLYARWDVQTDIVVNFDLNYSGSAANTTTMVAYDEMYGAQFPTIPTRVGYVFTGWFTATVGGDQVTETTKVATVAEHTLYARWEAKKDIVVDFDLNYPNSSTTVSSMKVAINGTYGEPTASIFPDAVERSGYNFVGWYDSSVAGNQVMATTVVNNSNNHTLYAHWTAKTDISVTFDLNYADAVNTPAMVQVEYDAIYGNNIPTSPTRVGYIFTGWFTTNSGGVQVTPTTIVATENAHTLYAQWETKKDIVVDFDLNYVTTTNPLEAMTVEFNQTYHNLPTPTRTGYTFIGWFDAVTAGNQVATTTQVVNANNHTLYAQWQAVANIKVTFNTQQKDSQEDTALFVTYDSTYAQGGIFPADPVSKEYQFTGWYTAKNDGHKVDATTVVNQTEDHVLYAQWIKKPAMLTPNINPVYTGRNKMVCGQGTPGQTVIVTLPNGVDTLETTVSASQEWCVVVPVKLVVGNIITARQQDEAGRLSDVAQIKVIRKPLYEIVFGTSRIDINGFATAYRAGTASEYIIDAIGAKVISTETGEVIPTQNMTVNISEEIIVSEGSQIQVELIYDANATDQTARTLRTDDDESVSRTITLTFVKTDDTSDTENLDTENTTTVVLPKTGENIASNILFAVIILSGSAIVVLLNKRQNIKR